MRMFGPLLPLVFVLTACGLSDDPRWNGPPQMLPVSVEDMDTNR